jgi:pentose-5-phosphate-3-epimerase
MGWDNWIRTVEVEPAVAAASPLALETQVESLLRTGCRLFHVDAAEGDYGTIDQIAPVVHKYDGFVDVHLAGAASVFEAVMRGADSVTVDAFAQDAAAACEVVREHGRQLGIVFPTELGDDWIPLDPSDVDLVLLAVDDSSASILRVREVAADLPRGVALQVEGGVGHENVNSFRSAGATVLVIGRPLFEREDLPRTYRRLVQALA